jgi:hypothetical protein
VHFDVPKPPSIQRLPTTRSGYPIPVLGRQFGALDHLAATPVHPEIYPCREWVDQQARH